MTTARRLPALAILMLSLAGLSACAGTSVDGNKNFIVLGEKTYEVPFNHMYTLAQRTVRDMDLARPMSNKTTVDAFIVFRAPQSKFAEMAMELKGIDTRLTHVTIFAHDHEPQIAMEDILSNLTEQIALDKDPLHKAKK